MKICFFTCNIQNNMLMFIVILRSSIVNFQCLSKIKWPNLTDLSLAGVLSSPVFDRFPLYMTVYICTVFLFPRYEWVCKLNSFFFFWCCSAVCHFTIIVMYEQESCMYVAFNLFLYNDYIKRGESGRRMEYRAI